MAGIGPAWLYVVYADFLLLSILGDRFDDP